MFMGEAWRILHNKVFFVVEFYIGLFICLLDISVLCDYNTAKNILHKIQNLNSKFLFLGRIEIVTGIVKIGLKIETENVIEEIESGRGRKKRRRNCELQLMLCLSVLDYHL